jgi:hypothetical protein
MSNSTHQKLKKRTSSLEEKLEDLRSTAQHYAESDKLLEVACAKANADPITCTVFALKKRKTNSLPEESFAAAEALANLVALHEELVSKFHMDTDEVRKIWFPILMNNVPKK